MALLTTSRGCLQKSDKEDCHLTPVEKVHKYLDNFAICEHPLYSSLTCPMERKLCKTCLMFLNTYKM